MKNIKKTISKSNNNKEDGASPKTLPYVLHANGSELLQLKVAFTIVLLSAIYVFSIVRFYYVLLIIFALVVALFYLWAHSIKFIVSQEGVSFKIGIASMQFLGIEEINEITMGFHPYGLNKANMLVIHSIHPSKADIRINYFLLFHRRELTHALKMILELNPRIQINQKTIEFLSDKPYSLY